MNLSRLEGRRVLVTGAAHGIGASVARAALAAGATVYLVDREPVDLSCFSQEDQGRIETSVTDLRDVDSLDALAAEVGERLGELDALVHVAGVIIRRRSFDEVTVEDFDLQYEVNLRGTFFLVARLRPLMAEGSSIVLFTSQGWWTGGLGGSLPYSATKAGVVALTRGFAREFAPSVRVNAIAPGFVDTAMMRNGLTDEQLERLVEQVPLGRIASPEEVADAALLLIDDGARYMTGATLNVTGGQLIY